MKLVNLTSKLIVVVGKDGKEIVSLQPSGRIVNVSVVSSVQETLEVEDGKVDVVVSTYSEVSGLPTPVEDTIYVVAYAVLKALEGKRHDVVAPDTSPQSAIRGEDNKVMAVRRLCRL